MEPIISILLVWLVRQRPEFTHTRRDNLRCPFYLLFRLHYLVHFVTLYFSFLYNFVLDNGRSITNLETNKLATLINVNVKGVIHGIKHAARAMISAGSGGSIVSSSSSAAIMGGLASHAYTLTKGAILGITRSAACELGVHGIRVNCVSPHGIPSEMLVKSYQEYLGKPNMTIEEVSDIIGREGSLLSGRCGSFEDVAQAVLFLASDEAGYITGHNLVVDGGFTSASVEMSSFYSDK
ncbi:putative xanthoxin dehydrogenase [Helianthus annuus]|nr:putative xanthoxin dehydrogenase [Helianthus annuus]